MSKDLVSIAHEFSPLKAKIIQSRLEADGIECFLAGEILASVAGPFSNVAASWEHPGGNIEIRVRASDVVAAKAILQEIAVAERDEEDENFVSTKPSFALQSLRILLMGWLVFALAMFVYGLMQDWFPRLFVEALAVVIRDAGPTF